MFSKKSEYGIKACIFIASNSLQNKRVSLREIAVQIDSPEAYTAKILQALVRAELIQSTKGSNGGYHLTLESLHELNLTSLVHALDGPNYLSGCVLGLEHCSDQQPCPFHDKWKVIRKDMIKILDSTLLYDLAIGLKELKTVLKQ